MKWRTAHTNTILFEKRKFGQNCHLLSLLVIRCQRSSLVVTRCHSLSLVVPLVVIYCNSLYHSLSLVVTRCLTRLSFYKRSSILLLLWRSVSYLLNSNFLILYICFCFLLQVMCSKWVSCSKSSHPKKLLQKISKNSKENLHYRVQLLVAMQSKLNLLKLRSTTEVLCKSSEVTSATNQNTFYQLHLKFLWTFS